MKEHGLLVVNTQRSAADIIASLPPAMRSLIEKRSIKVVTVKATQSALKYLKKNLPGAAIVGLINKELGILPEEEFEKRFTKILEKKIGTKKGQEAIGSNVSLLRDGIGLADASAALAAGMGWMATSEHAKADRVQAENFGQDHKAAGLPVIFEEKDELGTIKPIHLFDDYKEHFYQEW